MSSEVLKAEANCRGYADRILRAMGAASAEGLRVERTGNIKIFVAPQVARDFKVYARRHNDIPNYDLVFSFPDIGKFGGLDLIEDPMLLGEQIVFRYEIQV